MIRHALLSLAVACAALIPLPAAANDARITPEQVQAFYDAINASYKLPYEEHLALLKKSFREDFRSTVASSFSGPGIPPTSSRDMMSYKRLVEEAAVGHKAMQGASIRNETSNIRIAEDGKSVKVLEKSVITRMALPVPDGTMMYADTTASCEDELALSAEGLLQAVKSTCTVEGTIVTEREL